MEYVQCQFNRGNEHTVGWIPVTHAKVGNAVKMRESGDEPWSDFWNIVGVGTIRLDSAVIHERSQDYKNTRKASDA